MKIGRQIWTGVGLTLVGLGLIGVVVPGMPTTIFMILALYCFRRGSEKFENWLLNHKVFGPTLQDWERHKGIKRRTKIIAVVTLAVFICLSLVVIMVISKNPLVVAIVVGTGLAVSWYILSRPTIPEPGVDKKPDKEVVEDQVY